MYRGYVMANAKSNIYPIQLQGAELNLNKYDAEIKQYSGFNKNNSPFIGGCLSNIFTKNQTIEGASSKNTYITPNGDIYKVTTEGLFKNDTKLVDYTGKKFYRVEPLDFQFPENTRNVITEKCYITTEKGTTGIDYYLNVFNDFKDAWESIRFFENFPIEESDINRFQVKICKNDTAMFVVLLTWNTLDINSTSPYKGHNLYSFTLNETDNITQVASINVIPNRGTLTSILHLEKTTSNGGIITVLTNNFAGIQYQTSSWDHMAINYDFAMDGTVTFKEFVDLPENSAGMITQVNTSSGYKPTRPSAGAFYIFSHDRFYGCSLIQDTATIGEYYISNGKMYITKIENKHDYSIEHVGTIRILLQYDYGLLLNSVHDNSLHSVCDFFSYGGYGSQSNNSGVILGRYAMYNNMQLSGICTPSGDVLLTEWNTVESVTILDMIYKYTGVELGSNACVIYKTFEGKYYKIVESEPLLKKINNQIICNVDFYNNSYDIERNKLLLFAPAWNNRMIGYSGTGVNAVYCATAINEYNLEDNASISINPIPIHKPLTYSIDDKQEDLDYILSKYIKYNVYYGATPSEIVYRYSKYLGIDTVNKSDDLIGLPFPTNTDGNVQYSPSIQAVEKGRYGNLIFISEGGTAYKLSTYDNKAIMSYYLTTAIEGLQDFFTIQGQLYGIINNGIYNFSIVNEVANRGDFVVSIEGLQFCGNTPYEALFYSETNKCLYSFTGVNVLSAKQFVDKISEIRNYEYNPATQSIFLITDIGVIVYSLFGIYLIEFTSCKDMYLLNNGVILTDNEGVFKFVRYYKDDDDFEKENIKLETCFYGMDNQTVTVNDCLYIRLFSEEHEEGEVIISATTISLEGRQTDETVFRFSANEKKKKTHTIYFRYQPKYQKGLGISFSINSPFKIASLSVGSRPDAILVDKASKGAINAPYNNNSSIIKW